MDQSGITPNTSNQQLVINSDNESATALLQEKQPRIRESLRDVTFSEFMTVAILCFVNLINYMDRLTLAGLLDEVQKEFQIKDDKAGLLQTVFVIAYMVFAPIFGYLGDRYSRRWILVSGVALWTLTTLFGSFLRNYYSFALFRGLVGIGEASYSTIAPTIISDLFVGNVRSKMLAFFYFAIPVGSGLGYIAGSSAASIGGSWRWGLRVTPILGIVAVCLIAWFMEDPPRGLAEESQVKSTSYKDDVRSLIRNPSFMLSTIAFTCVAFVTGALTWWGPKFMFLGLSLQPGVDVTIEGVSLAFGVITMLSGLVGVPAGAWLGTSLIKKYPRSHPVICGLGLLISAPAMTLGIFLTERYYIAPFVLMFIAELTLNLNWAIVADMSLYVVVPPRRSSAAALQILISHMFGDAGSPYLVGVISEALQEAENPSGTPNSYVDFKSLQYSLFMTCFVEILGGIFFLITAIYIVKDKLKVDRAIAESDAQNTEPTHSNISIGGPGGI